MFLWDNTFRGQGAKKRRAVFTYCGTEYDLALTDPHMEEKYFPRPKQRNAGLVDPGPTSVEAICISLSVVRGPR